MLLVCCCLLPGTGQTLGCYSNDAAVLCSTVDGGMLPNDDM